jgi:hypothetical protein
MILVIVLVFGAGFGTRLAAQERRILGRVVDSRRVELSGHISPKARREHDLGPVDPLLKLNSVTLALKKSDAQQRDLENLLRDQQNPASLMFHQWLTPEQYADRFGLHQGDIAQIPFAIIGESRVFDCRPGWEREARKISVS